MQFHGLDMNSAFVMINHGVNNYGEVQQFIDSECIRLMKPYTPFLSGDLEDSVTLNTVIGSGLLQQNIPYAAYMYYGKLMVSSTTGSSYANAGESKVLTDIDLNYSTANHPNAGKLWFERMKADKKAQILKGAQQIAN